MKLIIKRNDLQQIIARYFNISTNKVNINIKNNEEWIIDDVNPLIIK